MGLARPLLGDGVRKHASLQHAGEAQRRSKEQVLINRVRAALMREVELSDVIKTVVEGIAATFGYTQVSLYLLKDDRLELKHQVGYDRAIDVIPTSRGVSGRVARTGRPVLVKDVRHEPEFIGAIDGVRSELCVPIFDQARVVGILNVESTSETRLCEDDLRLVTALGEHLSIALCRARLYEEIREREKRYRTLVENLGEGIAIVDPGENFLFANPAAEAVFGVAPGSLAGNNLRRFLSESDYQVALEETKRRRRGLASVFEQDIIQPDGTMRRIELTSTPQCDPRGEFLHTLVIFRDITDERRVRDELRRSEERFRKLFRGHAAAMLVIDPETGGILDANPAAAAFYGWSVDELTGMEIHQIDTELSTLRKAGLDSDPDHVKFEFRHRLADGSVRDVEVFNSAIELGGKKVLYSIIHDITDRKRMEAELAVSEERYRRLFEDAPIGIAFLGERREITLTNQRYRDFLGMAESEIIERGPAGILHPDDLQPSMSLSEKLRSGEIPLFHMEQRYIRGDAAVVWADTNITVLRDADGRLVHTIGWVQDITERKRAEAEKAKLQDQLNQAQKMESVGRLAGGVAHDFNNILGVILGNLALMREGEWSEAALLEGMEQIEKAANRAASLTRQLLLFSRQQVLDARPLDLNEVVNAMTKMLRRLIGEDIDLLIQGPSTRLWVKADPGMMEQVLVNLCVNARDAMPGGGRLTVGARHAEVGPDSAVRNPQSRDGSFVCLTVSDTGTGMEPETLRHIFEPFFTTKDPGKGTGLGLANVYWIVRQHEGWIQVDSEPGKGTTFQVFIPAGLPGEALRPAPRPVRAAGGTETILLVEDDPDLRRFVLALLRRMGYTVHEAADGVEALEAWHRLEGRVDVLLTDMVMPGGISGLELAQRLTGIAPGLKVIVTSGYNPEKSRPDAMKARGITFLPKPYNVSQLAVAVRDGLDQAPTVSEGAG